MTLTVKVADQWGSVFDSSQGTSFYEKKNENKCAATIYRIAKVLPDKHSMRIKIE